MVNTQSSTPLSFRTVLTTVLFLLFSTQVMAQLTASVNRTVVVEGEAIEYSLRSDGLSMGGSLDTSPLRSNFDILGTRQSNQIRMINGINESWLQWSITLMPKTTGELTIPSLNFKGETSNPITIEVRKASAQTQGAAASSPVYMRNSISDGSIWQGQEAILNLMVYTRGNINFADNPELSPPETDGAIFKMISNDQREERIIQGERYQVITVKYLVTPTRPGTLTIPAQTLLGAYVEDDPYGSSSMFRTMRPRPFRVSSPEMILKVNPVPASWPASQPWLPAEDVVISEQWSSNPAKLTAGDSITRTIKIDAKGSNSAQIPPLPALTLDGVNSYPDQAQTDDQRTPRGTVGIRTESTALVPTQAGTLALPAIEVHWFNTKTEKMEVSRLESQTLDVQPGAQGSIVTPPPANKLPQQAPQPQGSFKPSEQPTTALPVKNDNSQRLYWQLATLFFALLWLATLIAWWKKPSTVKASVTPNPNSNTKTNNADAAFQELITSCSQNNLHVTEQKLLHWGRLTFGNKIQSAEAVIQTLNHQPLNNHWQQLQSARYSAQKSGRTVVTKELAELMNQAQEEYRNLQAAGSTGLHSLNP